MSVQIPIAAVIVIPSLYLLWRAGCRDDKKMGLDGLDDWFKAWVYVALLWGSFYIGTLST